MNLISNRFGVDELKEMLAACGGKSMPFFEVISALNTHGENFNSTYYRVTHQDGNKVGLT